MRLVYAHFATLLHCYIACRGYAQSCGGIDTNIVGLFSWPFNCFSAKIILQWIRFAVLKFLFQSLFVYLGWISLGILCQICWPFNFCSKICNANVSDFNLRFIRLFNDAGNGAEFSYSATGCQNFTKYFNVLLDFLCRLLFGPFWTAHYALSWELALQLLSDTLNYCCHPAFSAAERVLLRSRPKWLFLLRYLSAFCVCTLYVRQVRTS